MTEELKLSTTGEFEMSKETEIAALTAEFLAADREAQLLANAMMGSLLDGPQVLKMRTDAVHAANQRRDELKSRLDLLQGN